MPAGTTNRIKTPNPLFIFKIMGEWSVVAKLQDVIFAGFVAPTSDRPI